MSNRLGIKTLPGLLLTHLDAAELSEIESEAQEAAAPLHSNQATRDWSPVQLYF